MPSPAIRSSWEYAATMARSVDTGDLIPSQQDPPLRPQCSASPICWTHLED
jgi:hypothetical protein